MAPSCLWRGIRHAAKQVALGIRVVERGNGRDHEQRRTRRDRLEPCADEQPLPGLRRIRKLGAQTEHPRSCRDLRVLASARFVEPLRSAERTARRSSSQLDRATSTMHRRCRSRRPAPPRRAAERRQSGPPSVEPCRAHAGGHHEAGCKRSRHRQEERGHRDAILPADHPHRRQRAQDEHTADARDTPS